jgi:hypothetical protein
MPGSNRVAYGNEIYDTVVSTTCTYPTLAANASGSNTQNIAGVQVGDLFSWNMQAPPAHLVLDNVYCSAPGVITTLWSTDSTGISTGSVTVNFEIVRPENPSALPANFL